MIHNFFAIYKLSWPITTFVPLLPTLQDTFKLKVLYNVIYYMTGLVSRQTEATLSSDWPQKQQDRPILPTWVALFILVL